MVNQIVLYLFITHPLKAKIHPFVIQQYKWPSLWKQSQSDKDGFSALGASVHNFFCAALPYSYILWEVRDRS